MPAAAQDTTLTESEVVFRAQIRVPRQLWASLKASAALENITVEQLAARLFKQHIDSAGGFR